MGKYFKCFNLKVMKLLTNKYYVKSVAYGFWHEPLIYNFHCVYAY